MGENRIQPLCSPAEICRLCLIEPGDIERPGRRDLAGEPALAG